MVESWYARRLLMSVLALAGAANADDAAALESFVRSGDGIEAPLGGKAGDAARGRIIVLDRALGNCLICHRVPVSSEPFQGDIGPDLSGVGARLSPAQLRLRLIDQSLLNRETMMPPYYRDHDLRRVASIFADKPILDAQQVEDVVAWLSGLRETPK